MSTGMRRQVERDLAAEDKVIITRERLAELEHAAAAPPPSPDPWRICRKTNGRLVCNVSTHRANPHQWHAAVTEGIVIERWHESECLEPQRG